MSDQVTLKQPLWTLEEEILLINSREATEKVVTYREVHHQIPHRSVHACLVHYGAIRKRELTADQLICIGELWSTYREEVFGQYARMCGVTIREFERVVHYIKVLGKPPLQDLEDLDCDLIKWHYETYKGQMWRVMASMVPGVSWIQVEASWVRSDGKFEESVY